MSYIKINPSKIKVSFLTLKPQTKLWLKVGKLLFVVKNCKKIGQLADIMNISRKAFNGLLKDCKSDGGFSTVDDLISELVEGKLLFKVSKTKRKTKEVITIKEVCSHCGGELPTNSHHIEIRGKKYKLCGVSCAHSLIELFK